MENSDLEPTEIHETFQTYMLSFAQQVKAYGYKDTYIAHELLDCVRTYLRMYAYATTPDATWRALFDLDNLLCECFNRQKDYRAPDALPPEASVWQSHS